MVRRVFSYAQPVTHETTWVVHTHQFRARASLRIADNCACTNNGCLPTDDVAGGLVKVDAGPSLSGWL